LGKCRLDAWTTPAARRWFELNEFRVKAALKNNGGLVHYFFPEDSLCRGGEWKSGARIAVTCHQPISYMKELSRKPEARGFFEGLKAADLVILMSDGELDEYKEFLPNAEIRCIRHGIDTDFFKPGSSGEAKSSTFNILTVGTWLRDYELWARVVNALSADRDDVKFSIVAKSHIMKKAQEACDSNVSVTCHSGVSDEDLVRVYQEADLLFLPLKDAWANNALLEAMATGTPVICSDLPATREYLGPDGIYAESQDDFTGSISRLLDDSKGRFRIGDALRQRACCEFDWRAIADQHMTAYKSILDG
jgi:glycosyltransferase involved in cell wall biosynthesis